MKKKIFKIFDGFLESKRIEMNNVFFKGYWDIEIEKVDENNNLVHFVSRKSKDRISINFSSKKDVMSFLDISETDHDLDEFSNGRFINKTNIIKNINKNKITIATVGLLAYFTYKIFKKEKGR